MGILRAGPVQAEFPDAERVPSRGLRVALVNMPWSRADAPSIQCGLLQALTRRTGYHCDVFYLNLEFAALVGGKLYSAISDMTGERLHLLGEWLFSFAAFGEITPDAEYLAEFPETGETWRELSGKSTEDLQLLRRERIPEWLDQVARRPTWATYDVAGFSSTFLQNAASLALGRRLKELRGGLPLVYGGANFDDVMGPEYLRALPWIDYVVSGEADVTFPELLNAIAAGDHIPIPGVTRQGQAGPGPGRAGPVALDAIPTPDYQDYFAQLETFGRRELLDGRPVIMPIEFSRGCWWGEKHHCTFCGLNALGMDFRAKNPERAMTEIMTLLTRYPSVHIEAVDNILDMRYLTSLCADMAAHHWDINVFYEVKANLTREQLSTLRRAGILRIQPGIESLSSSTLKIMRKGSSRLLNIRLLKWAKYYGIDVSWNLLMGFPGESDEDYLEQLELMPALVHLQPPSGCQRIWLERYSPYFEDSTFGFSEVTPRSCYRHIYPDSLDHAKIAYFFDYTAPGTCSEHVRARVASGIKEWKKRCREGNPSLVYQRLPGRLVIIDRRTAEPKRAVLSGWRADAYEACGDTPRSAARACETVRSPGDDVTEAQVTSFFEACCRGGVMIGEDSKYLSLALPENPGW
jgi:ribosomal peptide maturation radical SAM protein 1